MERYHAIYAKNLDTRHVISSGIPKCLQRLEYAYMNTPVPQGLYQSHFTLSSPASMLAVFAAVFVPVIPPADGATLAVEIEVGSSQPNQPGVAHDTGASSMTMRSKM